MALALAFNVLLLVGMTVLFVKETENYANETLANGGLAKSQTIAIWTRQTRNPGPPGNSTGTAATSNKDSTIVPADILKVEPATFHLFWLTEVSTFNTQYVD